MSEHSTPPASSPGSARTAEPVSPPVPIELDRRALVIAAVLLGVAALLTAARVPVGMAALSTQSLFGVLPVLGLLESLTTGAALLLVSGRRGISSRSRAGRVAFRVAAVAHVLVGVVSLPQTGLAAVVGPFVLVLLVLVSVVAAVVGAVLAASSGGLRGVAGWALLPWAVVALVRTIVFSTPIGFALGASSITAVALGGQVLTVVALLFAAVSWLVAGLRSPHLQG